MIPSLPDPRAKAREEAERILNNREEFLTGPVERTLKDSPFAKREDLLSGLTDFHQERMSRIPDSNQYPQAGPWIDRVLEVDRELQRLAKLSDREIALFRSLGAYLTFRGFARFRKTSTEKCRVAYIPVTDKGRMHIKNVDDPIRFWKPQPPMEKSILEVPPLFWDGVGNGMHIDDEPEEIFPLPVPLMCMDECKDVPTAVEFLKRYSPFWGAQNIVLRDDQGNSVAIEKASHNFIEVIEPAQGRPSYISGNFCRESPQAVHLESKRNEYVEIFGLPEYGPDRAFWQACTRANDKLVTLMRESEIKVDAVLKLFRTPWSEGLNKGGVKYHPDQTGDEEYTLITYAMLLDAKAVYKWQRDTEGRYPEQPEVIQEV
jgi:hypothetical protein